MRKFMAVMLAALMFLVPFCSQAEAPANVLHQVMEEQIALGGQRNAQGWLETALTEGADGTGGWYLIALRRLQQMGDGQASGLDFRSARAALEAKAAEEQGSITKRERMSLTLQALGSESDFIRRTAEDAVQETTLMPLVFALHLMNNGAETADADRMQIAERLMDLQLEDGGWAVIGTDCDVDCTAMTLQALAPMGEDPEIEESIDRGVEALSRIQQDNGGYLGMGLESAESCAQVLLALSCLGIDAREDERFLKNGCSVLDAMMRFRIEGDGFSHDLIAGKRNDTATVQCFYALVGYENMRQGGNPYYEFDFDPLQETNGFSLKTVPMKTWMYAVTAVILLTAWIIALKRKKRNWRSYVFPLLAAGAVIAAIAGIEIESPEKYYQGRTPAGERNLETTISIRCDTIAGENEYAPADGILLAEEPLMMAEGETAFDQLLEATRAHRIQMEYDGTTAGAYVRGIGYLYEYDFGNLSGWMYRVNGVYADVGCSQYQLQDGDRIEWVYTRNLGKDE